ncbi:peptidoglycan D,D-transpeptidase FtsI family protein, partial [Cellulomonas bogoriensis]|uniref:peptidoglycan D,D-transpeptidase FtsI family protein n=1 Tax=Cellulomonas bogoriensis TaxID=301388 RepID=UPI0005500A60
ASRVPTARPSRPAGRPAAVLAPAEPHVRQRILLAVVMLMLLVLVVRLVQVQAVDGQAIAAEAFDRRLHTVAVPADRGDIVDTNGVVLATSVVRYDIHANQRVVSEEMDPDRLPEVATTLAGLLDVPEAELAARLWGPDDPDDKRGFVYLARSVAPDVYEQVRKERVPGVGGDRTTDRIYPAGTTAGNVLGFVGAEGAGQAGLEQLFDEALTGTPGSQTFERGARGQRIPTGERGFVPAVAGGTLVTTLDRDLQFMAQQVLDEQVEETGAQWGAIQVMDVRTGEILVLADSGAVDPNDPGSWDADDRGSRSAWTVYEPGSTAKAITMAAVLEEGLAEPTSRFRVPDRYTVSGQTFRDSDDHEVLDLTLTGILAMSSNTGTLMAGERLPNDVRHEYLSRFGFGRTTGVGLPGESAGLLHDHERWDRRTQHAVLFGQGVAATTLQSTQVFATLANDGVRVQPHLVKGVQGPDGELDPVDVDQERVVSKETARAVVSMLESAVADGTGSNAAVPGYRVGGKTGTAQAFEGGGVVKHVASFIGVAPVEDPRLVVNVVLYDPRTSIYGGVVAAPLFSEVTGFALQYLGVAPSAAEPDLFPSTYE